MAEYTPNLSLLKKDPAVDGNDTFNIKTMLNDNWDKIDVFSQTIEEGLDNVDDVELAVSNLIEQVGNLEEVNTETKLNLVAAINEVYRKFNEHEAEKVTHLSYAIASGTDTYTVTIDGISSLVEGMSIKIKFINANTGTCTLNINSLGAIPIKKANGNNPNIKKDEVCHLVYTGTVFQLLGEGGEYGNAQANHVLSPYTFGTEEGIITGTMPNNGAINRTITTQNGQFNIPNGYTDGGVIKAQFANLVTDNIKKGVNIGGVMGSLLSIPELNDISSDYFQLESGDSKNYRFSEISSSYNAIFLIGFFSSGAYSVGVVIRGKGFKLIKYTNPYIVITGTANSITIKNDPMGSGSIVNGAVIYL